MPAYAEEGLAEFVAEAKSHLASSCSELVVVVVDDCSPRHSAADVLAPLNEQGAGVHVLRNERNAGHGPSALRAYAAGLEVGGDVVIHVDGDGQFEGADFPRLLEAVHGYDGAIGLRTNRTDPWFRNVISAGARVLVAAGDHGPCDVNSPMRAYQASALHALLSRVRQDASVPHLQFSLLERRLGLRMNSIPVTSRPRRGLTDVGTTWGRANWRSRTLPSAKLVSFVWHATGEVLSASRVPSVAPVALALHES
jgi:dolichol-phosphate mannosyltransferase